jgi:DNA-directed RNA polymerase subunit beta'
MVSSTKKDETMEFINYTVDKKKLGALLSTVYEKYGTARSAELANALKDLGFQFATKAGVTISIDDLDVPEAKRGLISAAEKEIEEAQRRYERGEITEVERYNKVIDTWSATTDQLTKEVVDNFDRLNPVYMMAFSGARGNISQVRQLVGMRGLMADSQGQIIDLPIKANFREGLNVTEYIISSYGARKGLVDTALKTADSGYLTRRLVDVAQDVIVRDPDCGTKRGILMQAIMEGDKAMVRLSERIYGRTLAEDALNEETGEVLARAGELIDRKLSNKLEESQGKKVRQFKVRSPLTCESQYGVCQKCYGWSLTNNRPVDIGEAIGIIAAQSIGEPGTQLTMRTFHTGGAVAGGGSRQQLKAPAAGEVTYKIATRQVRTAYGDVVEQTTKDGNIKVQAGSKEHSLSVPTNALILVKNGTEVTAGQVLAEFDPPGAKKNLTERATKDITADISGRVNFSGFQADEKRDRQGNISRTANRAGIIWVLEGDVYNLPSGAHVVVKDGQDVNAHDVLAEITINTEHGGEVRFGPEIETEQVKSGKKGQTATRLVKGKEINVIISSVGAANAKLEGAKQGFTWRVAKSKEGYTVKVVNDEIVENGKIIAELIDDGTNVVASGGEIIYDGVEIDDRRVVTKAGRILFVPEEVHFISKDISLKMSESGENVTAGQEVVKDVFAHMDGIVEIVADNDIIHEVIVRPGELLNIGDPADVKVPEGQIVEPGTEIIEGFKSKDRKIVNILEKEDGTFQVLVRPIEEYWIEPKETKFKHKATDDKISLRSVTQLLFRDREKVRHLQGAQLTRTSLVLQMGGVLTGLKGTVEIGEDLNIVVQENILLRRDTDLNVTLLSVQHGDMIPAKSPVATTQVLTKGAARVQLSKSDERRILLITEEQQLHHKTKGAISVKEGDLLRDGDAISKQSVATHSGQVVKIDGTDVVVRRGRPYLISANTQLQSEDGALVQRGDLLATLIFERQKTGDIVQGLPRVEELLEARKPKECAILAERAGRARISREDDQTRLFIIYGEGSEEEIIIPAGLNVIVEDGDNIMPGTALTDGPPNPHDIVRLMGIEAAQKYLVDEVQSVYRSQGVEIADKHIEVIVRQMTRKVRVDEPGETIMLPGELLERYYIEQENEKAKQIGIREAGYSSVLLGITKASLNTESFISAASFQETTRILTEAAVEGKKDWLRGLKENVIIGRLIPAGTGFQGHQAPAEEEEEEEDIYPPIGEGSFNVPN